MERIKLAENIISTCREMNASGEHKNLWGSYRMGLQLGLE